MSQCYHIELKSAVVRQVKGEDSVSYPIELTEILPPEEMKDLLREQTPQSGLGNRRRKRKHFFQRRPRR